MFIDDDLFNTHVFVLEGFPDCIDASCGRDLHLQAGKALSYKIDEVREANRDRVRSGSIDPFQELDELSISFLGIFEVSKAGGIEQITEFQPSLVTGLNVSFHMFSVDLWQDNAGSRPSDDIEGELAEERIDRCPF
jgi:hypothetical protein